MTHGGVKLFCLLGVSRVILGVGKILLYVVRRLFLMLFQMQIVGWRLHCDATTYLLSAVWVIWRLLVLRKAYVGAW